jgi:C4-dicarboxylate-specific signal transduction histidine kinase
MNDWSEKEVVFFGKITAGFTHELKNVLAIIKESSGLMRDILSLAPEALVSHQKKIENSLARIKDQVQRGVELADRLNTFAHSPDEAIAELDLYETIEQISALSYRFARLKNVDLQTDPPERSDQPLCFETRAVRIQMAMFVAIECCLEALAAGSVIRIGHCESEGNYAVNFRSEGNLSAKPEFIDTLRASAKWEAVQAVAGSLQGSAEIDESAPGIVLRFPPKMNR